MANYTLYHGTSTTSVSSGYLLPADVTGNLRETREKNTEYVFLTGSKLTAANYAKKAVNICGGEPIICTVEPVGDVFYLPGPNEYICKEARIISVERVKM